MSITYLDPSHFTEGPVFILIGKSALDAAPDILPLDTVPFITAGGVWGGSWRNMGFTTEDGFTHGGLGPETTAQMTAQQRAAASVIKGNSTQTIGCNLLEFTAQNMKDALGQGSIVTIATSDDLEVSDDPVKYVAIGIEAFGPGGKPLRIHYPIVSATVTGDIVNRIGQNATIPCSWTRAGDKKGNPHWHFVKPGP